MLSFKPTTSYDHVQLKMLQYITVLAKHLDKKMFCSSLREIRLHGFRQVQYQTQDSCGQILNLSMYISTFLLVWSTQGFTEQQSFQAKHTVSLNA